MGYWLGYEDKGNRLADVPANVPIVSLAFGLTGTDSTFSDAFLTSKHSKQDILDGIKVLKRRGQKVTISINGDNKAFPYGWQGLDPVVFAKNVKAFVDEYDLDGVDFDNEDPMYSPEAKTDGNFIQVIQEVRKALGPEAIMTSAVYMGQTRDLYLNWVLNDLTCVFTMAYWNDVAGSVALMDEYASLVTAEKVGVGVAMPGAANPGQNTDEAIIHQLAKLPKKAGIMLWHLNSPDAQKWCDLISSNLV